MSASALSEKLRETGNARAFKRFAIQFTILIKQLYDVNTPAQKSSKSSVTGVVTNISMSGLAFESANEYEPNSYLLIGISVALKSFELPVIVRHCTKIERPARTVYACGAQLVKSPCSADFIPTLAKYLIARGLIR